MEELNTFLDFVFKYYVPDMNNLILDQHFLNQFKNNHPESDEYVCKIVGQVRLTKHNILSCLANVFLLNDHELLRNDNIKSKKFYDYLKIIIKPGFKVNGEQLPFDFLYDLLNLEKAFSDYIKSDKNSNYLKNFELEKDHSKLLQANRKYTIHSEKIEQPLQNLLTDNFQNIKEDSENTNSKYFENISFTNSKSTKAQVNFKPFHSNIFSGNKFNLIIKTCLIYQQIKEEKKRIYFY